MEVKQGYKQTEVGILPEDWESVPLGSIASIAAGGTPSRRVPAYWDGRIPWVTTAEVNFNSIVATEQHISQLGLQHSAAKLLRRGTILLALYGQGKTRGKTALLEIEAATNQACAAIVLSTKVSRKYVFHSLVVQYHAIRGLSNTGSQENLSGRIVKNLRVPLPATKEEQEAIAEALSNADALTASLEQLVAKKRQLKHGAMQELLTGRTRLKGFSGEWETRYLGNEIEGLEAGVSVNSDADVSVAESSGAAILKTSCVEAGNFLPWQQKPIAARDLGRATLNPRADTILISRMNTIELVGECGYVDADYPDLYVPDRLWMTRFRKNAGASPKWLTYVLSSHPFRQRLKGIATGTSGSMKNIAKGPLLGLAIDFPPLREQIAIAGVLSDMDAEIGALGAKLAKARQVKQGTMQELLTGRIRLRGFPHGAAL